MPNGQQAQFDGQNPVAGYTLFHGKDGQSYYLKGEGLSDDEVSQRVAKIRSGQGNGIPDAMAQAKSIISNIIPNEEAYRDDPRLRNVSLPYDPKTGVQVQPSQVTGNENDYMRKSDVVAKAAATLPVAIAAPLVTATSLAGGYAGSKLAGVGARAFGASPVVTELSEDAGGLVGGLAGGIYGPRLISSATVPLRNAAFKELPTNGPQLTRGANRIARAAGTLAGGGAGSLTGIPGAGYAGGVAGFEMGPSLMERVLGAPEVGDIRNPGPFSKMPLRAPKAAAPEPELGSPENPGFYAKLPTRMPKAAPVPPVPAPSPFAGATPSNVPVGSAELPATTGEQAPFPAVQKPGTTPSAPQIVSPSAGVPRFTGNEGRAATWTNEDVMRLAQQGNREAIQQAVRRGFQLPPGARYVMGDPDFSRAVYNPREVTTFSPEGAPIRNLFRPPRSSGTNIEIPSQSTPRETVNARTGEVFLPQEPLQGNPFPFSPSTPTLRPEVQELATHSRAMQTPEWLAGQKDYEVRRLQDLLRKPGLSAEERRIAQAQLENYQ